MAGTAFYLSRPLPNGLNILHLAATQFLPPYPFSSLETWGRSTEWDLSRDGRRSVSSETLGCDPTALNNSEQRKR